MLYFIFWLLEAFLLYCLFLKDETITQKKEKVLLIFSCLLWPFLLLYVMGSELWISLKKTFKGKKK